MSHGAGSGIFAGLYPPMGPWTSAALWSGWHDVPPPSTPPEPEFGVISRQRLMPLLLRYVRSNLPELLDQLPPEVARNAFELAAVSSLVLVKGAVVSQSLQDIGIPNVTVKGPTIAAAYPSWQERPFADLDLYVPGPQFRAAARHCEQLGMAEDEVNRQPREWFDWTCREALNLTGETGVSIDLHHHVPPWLWGRGLRASDLIARGRPMEMLGQTLMGAPPEDNLLIAALHVVSDKNAPGATLMIWRDLAQLSRLVDVEVVLRRASDAGLAGWLRGVLAELPAHAQPTELLAALKSLPFTMPGRRRLESLLSGRLDKAGVVATQSLRLPAWRAAAFTAGMVFPSRDFLDRAFPDSAHPQLSWWRAAATR